MSLLNQYYYRFGEFTVDTGQKVLLREDKPLPLPPKLFDTLLILVENSGRIVQKEELMTRLWPNTFVEEANLTSNVQQLRKSLGDDARRPRYIETVARRGYRFIASVATDEQARSIEAWSVAHDVRPTQSESTQAQGSLEAADFLRRSLRRWPAFLLIAIVLIVAP